MCGRERLREREREKETDPNCDPEKGCKWSLQELRRYLTAKHGVENVSFWHNQCVCVFESERERKRGKKEEREREKTYPYHYSEREFVNGR